MDNYKKQKLCKPGKCQYENTGVERSFWPAYSYFRVNDKGTMGTSPTEFNYQELWKCSVCNHEWWINK